LSQQKKDIQEKLESGYFQQLWLSYQRRKTSDVTPQRVNKFLSLMSNWIQTALNHKLQVYVIGVTGNHWDNTTLSQLVTDKLLKQTLHRICHLGIKLNPKQQEPSNVCIKILSNQDISPHPCLCKLKFAEHKSDWKTVGSADLPRPKDYAVSFVCGSILTELLGSGGRLPEPKGESRRKPKTNAQRVTFAETESQEQQAQCAYPTDQREEWKRKQKENKASGLTVQKRQKVIENHFDDCGTDISGLGPADDTDYCVIEPAMLEQDSDDEFASYFTQSIEQHWFKDSEWNKISSMENEFPTAQHIHVFMLMSYLETVHPGVDIVELCGGEGRVSYLAIKRQCKVGPNFDLVTDWDLNDPAQQREVERYFDTHKP